MITGCTVVLTSPGTLGKSFPEPGSDSCMFSVVISDVLSKNPSVNCDGRTDVWFGISFAIFSVVTVASDWALLILTEIMDGT